MGLPKRLLHATTNHKPGLNNNTYIIANINGLYTKSKPYKIPMIRDIAIDKSASIISLTESHLNPDVRDAEIEIEGYQAFRTERENEISRGGIIVYIKDGVENQVKIIASGSINFIEYQILYLKKINLLLITVYRSPQSDGNSFSNVMSKISETIKQYEDKCTSILMNGDFNLPHIIWDHGEISSSENNRLNHRTLKNFAEKHALVQKIDKPTRLNNILDLVFTNDDDLFSEYTIEISPTLSDHSIIVGNSAPGSGNKIEKISPNEDSFRSLNFRSERINWVEINQKLANVDWINMFNSRNLESIFKNFSETLFGICATYVPKKKTNKRKTRIPRDRKILMQKRSRIQKQIFRSHGGSNTRLSGILQQTEEQLTRSYAAEIKEKEEKAIANIGKNEKYFFIYARSKSKLQPRIGPFLSNGEVIEDPKEKANILKKHFESVFVNEEMDTMPIATENNWPTLSEITFNEEDVLASMKKLQEGAAAGPDEIPAILLKRCAEPLKNAITMLWKLSMEQGYIPQILKAGLITPIYKSGPCSMEQNYRPISLTSHITKVFERIVVKKLNQYLESNDLFNEGQHGFRSGRSCLSQLLAHHNNVIEGLINGQDVDVIYLDFAKAFDKVHHGILLNKLKNLGIRGEPHKWLEAFLRGRTQKVSVEGALSDESKVTSGVPQGTVLGPVLFLTHISDINSKVEHSKVTSFADDTRILKWIKTPTDRQKLQEDLDKIYKWSEDNKMKFNDDKFELISYPVRRENHNQPCYSARNGSQIDNKLELKDLGILLSKEATFSSNINQKVATAKKLVGWIYRTFHSRGKLAMMTLFKSLVIPRIEYCCQLWNPDKQCDIRDIEGIQKSFTKKITGMNELNYWQRLTALNLYSLERRRERYIIIYMWKIIRGAAPNVDGTNRIQTANGRHGLKCVIPGLNRGAMKRIQTQKDNSFFVKGPKLFNCLPKEIRESTENQDIFKRKLDKFLKNVPDQPNGSGGAYSRQAQTNSLLHQVPYMRVDRARGVSPGSLPQE